MKINLEDPTKAGPIPTVKAYKMSPTGERFHNSTKFVRGIMGPFGSGKSTMCCWEILMKSCAQAADPKTKERKTRWAVIRNSYPELKSTTIQTWKEWFGSLGRFTYGSPIEFNATFDLPDKTKVVMTVYFLALDSEKDMRKLLSLEVTGAWINEAREVSQTALVNLRGRVGRYPPAGESTGASWHGIIMDTNPPDDDHWWYVLAEEEKPLTHEFFKQPGGYREAGDGVFEPDPGAENISFLKGGYKYYYNLMDGAKKDWIRVHVCGKYGTIRSGRLVYPEYDDDLHCSKEDLEPYRGLPLLLGWDFGLTPAVAFCQQLPGGQFRVIDELCALDIPLRQFLETMVRPHIQAYYGDMTLWSYADPAGTGRTQTDGEACINILCQAGIYTRPASTQNPVTRRDAISRHLLRRGGFLLSPKCKTLRKGFLSKYVHERVRVSNDPNDVRYKDEPVKNFYSHIHDALQYAALGGEAPFVTSGGNKRQGVQVRKISLEAWT